MIGFCLLWYGCSSGNETAAEDESVTEFETQDTTTVQEPVAQPQQTVPIVKEKSAPQHFTVQADTVDVQKKQRQSSAPSSISVKASAPKRFYTVEVGAFKLQSNVKRHQEQLSARFKLPVRILFDSTLQLTRVCVGTFSTRSAASQFISKMNKEYPQDYPGIWVSHWTK
ncbi:MAG: SPOR domain-containing protein [Bacteroidota bacterium]